MKKGFLFGSAAVIMLSMILAFNYQGSSLHLGNITIQNGNEAPGKILKCTDSAGHVTWSDSSAFIGATGAAGPTGVTGATGPTGSYTLVIDSVATSSGAATLTVNSNNSIVASGAITSCTLTFPTAPADGSWIQLSFTRAVTTLTLTAGAGDALDGTASVAATVRQVQYYQYSAHDKTWY